MDARVVGAGYVKPGPTIVTGVGLGLLLFQAGHLLDNLQGKEAVRLAIDHVPLVAAGAILAVGLWLATEESVPDGPILRWSVLGGATVTGFSVVQLLHQRGAGVELAEPFIFLVNALCYGIVGGIVIGLYDTRREQWLHRAQKQAAVTATEQRRFEALFENSPDPAVYCSLSGGGDWMVTRVNDSFEEVFGFVEAEMVDSPLVEFVIPPGKENEGKRVGGEIEAGESMNERVRRRTAYGIREFKLIGIPLEANTEGNGACFIYQDVTESVHREQRLSVLNRVLRHDLRNDVNVILGYVKMLTPSTDQERDAIECIEDRANRMANVGDEIRTLEHELDAVGLDAAPTDLDATIRTVAEDVPAASISTSFDTETTVYASPLLEKALARLVRFFVTEGGDAETSVSITGHTYEPAFVGLRFETDGSLPRTELLVFESESEKPLRHASGLDMWLVKWVVTNSGGVVDLVETADGTTRIEVRLPRAPSTGSVDDELDHVGTNRRVT